MSFIHILIILYLISIVFSDKINDLNQELTNLEKVKESEKNKYKEISINLLFERKEIIKKLNENKDIFGNNLLEELNNQLSNNLDKSKNHKISFDLKISEMQKSLELIKSQIEEENKNLTINKSLSASGGGDPHYMGFNRQRFDLQPIGDSILVISEKIPFEIHCRQNCWGNCQITVISSCIIKYGDDFVEYNGNRGEIFHNKKKLNIEDIYHAGLIKIKKKSNQNYEFSSDGIIFNFSCYLVNSNGVCNFSLTIAETIIQNLRESILGNATPGNERKIIKPKEMLFVDEFSEPLKDNDNKQIKKRELNEEEKILLQKARENPDLTQHDIENIEFDLINSPEEFKDNLFKINVATMIENNINIKKNEDILNTYISLNDNLSKKILNSFLIIILLLFAVIFIYSTYKNSRKIK